MLEIWRIRRAPSLPSLPGALRPGAVASDRDPSMSQIKLNCVVMLY